VLTIEKQEASILVCGEELARGSNMLRSMHVCPPGFAPEGTEVRCHGAGGDLLFDLYHRPCLKIASLVQAFVTSPESWDTAKID
jgi:hypothetical protein